MKNKQTIVEVIENWLSDMDGFSFGEADKAVFMKLFREQIIDAYTQCGVDNFDNIKVINRSAVEYYNETYGKQSTDSTDNQ